ncbi:MAG TPA: alpha/beta fold hydrolase [Bellilinea sp.]|nr:alpha/beta fold hydrolase [Bellilinea sp.]
MKYDNHSDLSIYHLTHFPAGYDPANKSVLYPTILALHGHGSNERDLIGLSESLQENLLWVSGRGPVDFAPGAYDWYPITQFGKPDPELLNQGLKRIDKFITELMNTYPIDPKRFFLMGFSQGSMISMSYLLTHPQRVAGVIAQSGYIPLENRFLINDVEVTGKPVIMTHGFEDSRMPLDWSLQTRDLLLHYGVDLEYHNFHMDHTITTESLQMIRGWLDRRI